MRMEHFIFITNFGRTQSILLSHVVLILLFQFKLIYCTVTETWKLRAEFCPTDFLANIEIVMSKKTKTITAKEKNKLGCSNCVVSSSPTGLDKKGEKES